jgi:hypothetical protein
MLGSLFEVVGWWLGGAKVSLRAYQSIYDVKEQRFTMRGSMESVADLLWPASCRHAVGYPQVR